MDIWWWILEGHDGIQIGGSTLRPFGRVSNVLDNEYNGSMVVNAFGGRYYEPAAGRAFQIGMGVSC